MNGHFDDPLGEGYMRDTDPAERRKTGSVYTPMWLVGHMLDGLSSERFDTIVDCGCGSGRFAVEAAKRWPDARVVAVDASPVACEMCAANADSEGVLGRVSVVQTDFLRHDFFGRDGRTLWLGNPPYVRHHDLDKADKQWFKETCAALGCAPNALAGLHVYFLAKIAAEWREGDQACLVTSAEWMDVKYGSVMRSLLAGGLKVRDMELYDRDTEVFEGTMSTAVVFTCGGAGDDVRLTTDGHTITRKRADLGAEAKWSRLFQETKKEDAGLVPLGSMARVHRGTATGDNKFWVRPASDLEGVPDTLTRPVVSKAKELKDGTLDAGLDGLKRLITLPADLGTLTAKERAAADAIVHDAETRDVPSGYIASHRNPWWSVAVPEAPAILMTYMGRTSPRFVVNERGVVMLNTIHGVYPTRPMSKKAVANLAEYLNGHVDVADGRTYCGGLTKFEPREVEALMVPPLEVLEEETA